MKKINRKRKKDLPPVRERAVSRTGVLEERSKNNQPHTWNGRETKQEKGNREWERGIEKLEK